MKSPKWYLAHSRPFRNFNFHPIYLSTNSEHSIFDSPINSCNSLIYGTLQFTHTSVYLSVWLLLSLTLGMLTLFSWETEVQKDEVTRPWSHSWYTAGTQIQTSWLLVRWGFFSALKLPTLSTCSEKNIWFRLWFPHPSIWQLRIPVYTKGKNLVEFE